MTENLTNMPTPGPDQSGVDMCECCGEYPAVQAVILGGQPCLCRVCADGPWQPEYKTDHGRDNTFALTQVATRLERLRMGWSLVHDPSKHLPELRYEMRIFDGPARGFYRGSTLTMAATAAQDALNDHRVGWDS